MLFLKYEIVNTRDQLYREYLQITDTIELTYFNVH